MNCNRLILTGLAVALVVAPTPGWACENPWAVAIQNSGPGAITVRLNDGSPVTIPQGETRRIVVESDRLSIAIGRDGRAQTSANFRLKQAFSYELRSTEYWCFQITGSTLRSVSQSACGRIAKAAEL